MLMAVIGNENDWVCKRKDNEDEDTGMGMVPLPPCDLWQMG